MAVLNCNGNGMQASSLNSLEGNGQQVKWITQINHGLTEGQEASFHYKAFMMACATKRASRKRKLI